MRTITRALVAFAAAVLAGPAPAASTAYPLSGRWAAVRDGGAADCRTGPFMEFRGSRRLDFGNSSVGEYRALSVVAVDGAAFRITELFFNGQVEGQLTYTLQLQDGDHASLRMQAGGAIALARCA